MGFRISRRGLTVGAAVVLVCAATRFSPHPDPPGVGEFEPPDPAFAAVAVRSVAKDLVVREVIAGRMALPEAAAQFAWLNELPPPARVFPPDVPASQAWLPERGEFTGTELLAAQVVEWAANAARAER